jgi:allophanate hydrolase subunit 1
VAIGGSHTGVYPFETPGGWRLIGKTPLEIFDPSTEELSRLAIGDMVKFVAVS